MGPHRILFIECSVGGVLGGSLTGILHLIDRLDRRRFEPVLVLFEHKRVVDDLRAKGVRVHVVPDQPDPLTNGRNHARITRGVLRVYEFLGIVLPRARAISRVVREEQPSLVYLANGLTSNLDGLVAAARAGIPSISHQKGFRRIGPIERQLARWVDLCIGMTDECTDYVRDSGAKCQRFLTVFDGIDCTEFAPGGGQAVRAEFGVPDGAPLVGLVGHVQEWKGQHIVAEAVARALKKIPDLHCLLVGGLHRAGQDFGEKLRAKIADQGLSDRIIMTGERSDVPACLDAMDILIHSSTTPEPFGRVMIEGMALSKPVIAPSEGGPLEIVVDGETGILIEPRSPEALADAIVTLCSNPELSRKMGQAGRDRVDAVFDIRHHVAAIEALFDECIGDTAARPSPAALGAAS